jgi:hypothetical protein
MAVVDLRSSERWVQRAPPLSRESIQRGHFGPASLMVLDPAQHMRVGPRRQRTGGRSSVRRGN